MNISIGANEQSSNPIVSSDDTLCLRLEDIQRLRGRYEQLEYTLTNAISPRSGNAAEESSTTTAVRNDNNKNIWKDFRRIYTELEILQEELYRNPEKTSLYPDDLILCLKHCDPLLSTVWKNFRPLPKGDPYSFAGKAPPSSNNNAWSLSERLETRTTRTPAPAVGSNHRFWALPDPPRDVAPSRETPRIVNLPSLQLDEPLLGPSKLSGPSHTLLYKSSSLIFPTSLPQKCHATDNYLRQRINARLDKCEATFFLFKKKLILQNLGMKSSHIPVQYICGSNLGEVLSKLSLAQNTLETIPPKLVQNLPSLRQLDLTGCELFDLPRNWNLPMLNKLVLAHNRLKHFPDESVFRGLPELKDLNLYGNKIASLELPRDPSALSKLEHLNIGYNDLAYLPEDLDELQNLKTLALMNNFLEVIPRRICFMNLKSIDVSFNPLLQPPMKDCESGIVRMRRFYINAAEEKNRKASGLFGKNFSPQK